MTATPFGERPVARFLDDVAARTPAPGGGAVAAVSVAAAAALVSMAARFSSSQVEGAAELADRADALRARALTLADEDAAAYAAVLDARRRARETGHDPARREGGDDVVDGEKRALHGAARVPLETAECAAEVAALGQRLVADGKPELTGDAATAVFLCEGAARAAAALVRANVARGDLGPDLPAAADAAVAAARRVHRRQKLR
jgi:methenyltetrahydrofolate cyclohydrolase